MLNTNNFAKGFANVTTIMFKLLKNIESDAHKDIFDKLSDLVFKAVEVNDRIKAGKELNSIELKLYNIICRFSDNTNFKELSPLKAAYYITKGIYYPALRH